MRLVLAEVTFHTESDPDGGSTQAVALGGNLVVPHTTGRSGASVGEGNGVHLTWPRVSLGEPLRQVSNVAHVPSRQVFRAPARYPSPQTHSLTASPSSQKAQPDKLQPSLFQLWFPLFPWYL